MQDIKSTFREMNMKKEHCPLCGEKNYYHQIKPMRLTYKGQNITVDQPGYWCNSCDEAVIGGKDLKATQKELQSFRALVDNLLPPDEIKRVRLKLKLSQRRASQLFGGGINAFSRYERGETPVSRSTSQLLNLLDHHPDLLKELIGYDNNNNFAHA